MRHSMCAHSSLPSKLSPDLTGLDSNVAATDTWNYVLLAYVCFHVLVGRLSLVEVVLQATFQLLERFS